MPLDDLCPPNMSQFAAWRSQHVPYRPGALPYDLCLQLSSQHRVKHQIMCSHAQTIVDACCPYICVAPNKNVDLSKKLKLTLHTTNTSPRSRQHEPDFAEVKLFGIQQS